ncbi:ABC transporter ATP-binding protein [Halobacteriales archaeon SW_5_70_135]|nr:MAG: ABC transporter ATP-binding protein [Halobacteriales archaeon SW_5_70_135]
MNDSAGGTGDPARTERAVTPTSTSASASPDERDEPSVLELADATREYDTGAGVVRALDGVDLRVDRGESLAVIGPSGSGKSTTLNLLGLLDAPTEGTVRLDGRDVTAIDDREATDLRREFVGFVFQDFYLIPTLTARENVAMPTMFQGGDRGRAAALLERVGLGDRLDHYPSELSGGQKQRVAIARSLVNEPEVVLADEPTGNLDLDTSERVLDEFDRVREQGVSVVLVTHDPLVTEYAGRAVELVDGRVADRDAGGTVE